MSDLKSESDDRIVYVKEDDNGSVTLMPDAHINVQNIDMVSFSFDEGKDITESVSRKNAKNKNPISYTKKGRTAYTPVTVTYPDGFSTSSKFMLEDVVIQHTAALNAANYTYAKEFAFFGFLNAYIDKIIKDARDNSSVNLELKPNTAESEGYFWPRCSLEKLSHRDVKIVDEEGSIVAISLDTILKEAKQSITASVVFSMSGSMTNNDTYQELDLKDGTYQMTFKPTEIYINGTTGVKGPELVDTNNRKKESAGLNASFVATGLIAEIAARRIRKK